MHIFGLNHGRVTAMPDPTTLIATDQIIQGSIELSNPEWLWLLPVLFVATLVWRSIGGFQQPSNLATGGTTLKGSVIHPLISLIPKSYSTNKIPKLNIVVYTLAVISLVISLADPVLIGDKRPAPPQERDIIFIVDASISMTLRDYLLDGKRIDRMMLLKGVLDRFIQRFPGERIGIIIFGDAAYTLVPLTHDQHLVRRMLSRIEATMIGRFNNMGEAISLGVKQASQQSQDRRHRVLVMLTDADKPTGAIDPYAAADLALEAGIPLYTIAIGASATEAEEKRMAGLIYETVDNNLLSKISERTGGRNYQAADAKAFENAVNDISLHETNDKVVPALYYREPLYQWPLLFTAALFFILIVSRSVVRVVS